MIATLMGTDNILYGILTVENADAQTVQNKINEIKDEFYNEGYEWYIEDVLEAFPCEWEWSYEDCIYNIEI